MSSSTQSRSLPEFLKKHKYIKGVHDKISHTRIPNSQLKIYGGAYYIDMNDQAKKDEFLKLYYEWVFTKQKDEYLTETQSLSTDSSSDPNKWGPILVDFDFRYPINITTRQHTENHITDMIDLYFDKIKEFYEIKNLSEVDIYIMEKHVYA